MLIKNQNQEVQIDNASYVWIAKKELGSLSVTMPSTLWDLSYFGTNSGPYIFNGVYFIDVPSSPVYEGSDSGTIAIKLSDTYYYNVPCTVNAYITNETPNFWKKKIGVTGVASDSFSIPYAYLYYSVAVPEEGPLRIWWESGAETGCIFSTAVRLPEVVGFYNVATPITGNPPFSDVDQTVSDAVNNFFVLKNAAWAEHQTGDPDWHRYYNIAMKRTSSTNVRITANNYYSEWNDQGGSGTHNNYTPSYLQLIEFKIPGLE